MEAQVMALIFRVVFIGIGALIFLYGLYEVWEEKSFKEKALRTVGVVVGSLASRYVPRSYNYTGGSQYTSESPGGAILIFEYEIENGDVYQQKSKYPIKGNPSTLEILYHPENPTDIMINGFYKVGIGKYVRVGIGLFWLICVTVLILL
ncbi:MAG: DUF3592 domain-containing protein [Flammeovirgaceae bacterium]